MVPPHLRRDDTYRNLALEFGVGVTTRQLLTAGADSGLLGRLIARW
jgi:hypothetical protein